MISRKNAKIGLVMLFFMSLALIISCAGVDTKTPAQAEFDTGLSLFNRGQFEEAASHFAKATEHQPDFGEAYLYLGRSYLNLGKWREALPPLRAAYRLSPDKTKKEIADIIIDVLLMRASQMEPEIRGQMEDLIKKK